jgi:hypothetical protein
MKPHKAKLKVVDARALQWGFSSSWPVYRGAYSGVHLDPMPCYSHDLEVVSETLKLVEAAWPAEVPITFHIADFEETTRTLAHTQSEQNWVDDKEGDEDDGHWEINASHIFLSGKRTPIHPAVTRYLVGHEYGHAVEDWIWSRLGTEEKEMQVEYAKIRPGTDVHHGDVGVWHNATSEVMACDFRILIAKIEKDYWPHYGVARPGAKQRAWWRKHMPKGEAA